MATLERGLHTDYQVTLLEGLWPEPAELRRAALGSAVFHLVVLALVLVLPREFTRTHREAPAPRRVTILYDPPTRLTQKAPNRAPLSHEISLGAAGRAPRVAVPKPRPAPQVAVVKPAQTRQSRPVPAPEPPKAAINVSRPPALPPANVASPSIPNPQPPQAEPQITLENVPSAPESSTRGTGKLKIPTGGVQDVIREMAKAPQPSARAVGDTIDTPPDIGLGPAPGPTRPKSNVELLSDPMGVDFRPYLQEVLFTVRKNWFAVYPESARLGQRGRVTLQFAVTRDGKIAKVVFTTESGARALDRAAVAALSASDPLPQLPPAFKGERIVLQFSFAYNAPR